MNECIYQMYRSVLNSAGRSKGWVPEGGAWITFSLSNVVSQNHSVKSESSSSSSCLICVDTGLMNDSNSGLSDCEIDVVFCYIILAPPHTHKTVGRENHSSHFLKEYLAASSPQGLYCSSRVVRLR